MPIAKLTPNMDLQFLKDMKLYKAFDRKLSTVSIKKPLSFMILNWRNCSINSLPWFYATRCKALNDNYFRKNDKISAKTINNSTQSNRWSV